MLNISSKFRLKTPSGLGDPSIESLGLFRGLIFRGGRYYRHCVGSTDDLIFSSLRVLIGSTDTRSVVPMVGSNDPVPVVPITWFLGASKPISVVPTWGR
jgi:hypothetical protein